LKDAKGFPSHARIHQFADGKVNRYPSSILGFGRRWQTDDSADVMTAPM
jgi:hypothetical protein